MDSKKFAAQFNATISEENIKKIGRKSYLATHPLWELRDSLDRDIYSIGILLGEEKDKFYPTPAFLDIIAKNAPVDRKIFVNKKAEWLFLCGRNILEPSILKKNVNDGLVLVQNENDENIGYGMFMKQGESLIIKNLLDRGSYLRVNERGRKKR